MSKTLVYLQPPCCMEVSQDPYRSTSQYVVKHIIYKKQVLSAGLFYGNILCCLERLALNGLCKYGNPELSLSHTPLGPQLKVENLFCHD